jgi:hypothetical protein
MKVNNHIFSYGFLLCMLALASNGLAQDKTDAKKQDTPASGGITEEIEVVRPYKPVLADAVKIRRSPDLTNNKPFKPQLSYNVFDNKFELNTELSQLQALKVASEQQEALRNNLVKIGAGNFNTGLGELYLNTGRDAGLQAGMFFKHLNQQGSLEGQKISKQQATVFGRSILDKITLNGEMGFERNATNFYAFNPVNPLQNPDPGKQRYSTVSLKGELLKNYVEDDQNFTYAARADVYFLRNYYDARENAAALSAFLNKTWNQFNFGADASLDITGTKDNAYSIGNNLFRANPYVKFQGETYKLIIGLNFIQEFGDNSRTNLLPAISGEFPVVPGYATIFGGLTGDVQKTSLRDISNENPFLNSNINIVNAVEKMNLYGGIKGNAGSGFGFKASVFFKKIQNMPLFINGVQDLNKFDVIYDNGDSKVLGFEGEISVNASEVLTWTGKLNMNHYTMATEKEAWFKPDFRLISNARLSINKKFSVDGEVVLNGETKGRTYTFTSAPEEQIVSVKSFVDFSAGAEYRFQEKIGVFLRANNIFDTKYQQYLYYPKLGFNILGGFNYSF